MVQSFMPALSFQEVLPYRAADLYDLVMDIERYPSIFSDIEAVSVRRTGEHRRDVDVTVRTPLTAFRYRCDVTGEPPSKISIRATEGAFQSMNAEWRFTSLADGRTLVRYDMKFDFGGWGLKNMIAETFIRQSMAQTQAQLRQFVAENLKQVPSTAAPQPPGM